MKHVPIIPLLGNYRITIINFRNQSKQSVNYFIPIIGILIPHIDTHHLTYTGLLNSITPFTHNYYINTLNKNQRIVLTCLKQAQRIKKMLCLSKFPSNEFNLFKYEFYIRNEANNTHNNIFWIWVQNSTSIPQGQRWFLFKNHVSHEPMNLNLKSYRK